jgi:hypothetical protein
MHVRLRSLGQGQVHVGPIPWEVLPQHPSLKTLMCVLPDQPIIEKRYRGSNLLGCQSTGKKHINDPTGMERSISTHRENNKNIQVENYVR